MTSQARTKLMMWLVLVAVFLLGSVSGAALTGLIRSRASGERPDHERAMKERFDKMRSELNLSDQQTTAVRAILEETRNEYRALKTELRPRFEEPRQKARTKIRALLTPDQQQKFDAMVAQQDAQREGEQRKQR